MTFRDYKDYIFILHNKMFYKMARVTGLVQLLNDYIPIIYKHNLILTCTTQKPIKILKFTLEEIEAKTISEVIQRTK